MDERGGGGDELETKMRKILAGKHSAPLPNRLKVQARSV
jgi:hypothetical protein